MWSVLLSNDSRASNGLLHYYKSQWISLQKSQFIDNWTLFNEHARSPFRKCHSKAFNSHPDTWTLKWQFMHWRTANSLQNGTSFWYLNANGKYMRSECILLTFIFRINNVNILFLFFLSCRFLFIFFFCEELSCIKYDHILHWQSYMTFSGPGMETKMKTKGAGCMNRSRFSNRVTHLKSEWMSFSVYAMSRMGYAAVCVRVCSQSQM